MQRIFSMIIFFLVANSFAEVLFAEKRITTVQDIAQQDFERAKNLFQIGEIAAATAALEMIMQSYPQSETAMQAVLLLGEIYLEQKKPDKAIQVTEKYLALKVGEIYLKRIQELKKRAEQVLIAQKKLELSDVNATQLSDSKPSVPLPKLEVVYPVSSSNIGLILPLSGQYAVYGERILIAVQMALKMPSVKFNGKPFMIQKNDQFTLIVADSKGDVKTSEELVENLVKQHQVIAILGDILIDSSAAVARKAQELAVVNLSLSRQDNLTQIGSWIFRFGLTTKKQTQALVTRMRQERDTKKFAVLYPTNAYGIDMKDSFVSEVKRQGGEIVAAVSYQQNETTFMSYVSQLGQHLFAKSPNYLACMQQERNLSVDGQIKVAAVEKCKNLVVPTVKFDALFIPDFPKTLSYIIPTLVAQDFLVSHNETIVHSYRKRAKDARPIQLLGPNSWNGDLLSQRLGEQLDGAMFVDAVNWQSGDLALSAFAADYKQLTHSDPGLIEAQAYDAAHILAFLLNPPAAKSHIKTRQDLVQSLLQIKGFTGITGLVSFDASRDSNVPLTWFIFEKGQRQTL